MLLKQGYKDFFPETYPIFKFIYFGFEHNGL
jgi:hypothetical protein